VFRSKAPAAGIDGLEARARQRLDRFAALFDNVTETDLIRFAGPEEPDARLRSAMATAEAELRVQSRRDAVKAAVNRFVHAAQQRYAEHFSMPELFGMGAIARQSTPDRIRVFQALERAVVAVVLWDHLDDETRTVLAGPWAEIVDAAMGSA
jgi:uncharacterized protein (DUF2235 family)